MQLAKTSTKDKIQLAGLFSETKSKDNIVINIHGMSGDFYTNKFYDNMHDYYPKNNYAFLSTENRGSSSIKLYAKGDDYETIGNAFEIFEDCILDIQAWVDFAIDKGYKKIFLQSHSLGPSKVAYYITQTNHKNIHGLIFLSPSDMLGLVKNDENHKILYSEAQELINQNKHNQILSKAVLWESEYLSAKTYLNFFSDNSNTAIFNYARQDLGWNVVNKIDLPVLAITGTNDDGIVPCMDSYKAMELLKCQLKSSPMVTTKVYENAEHTFDGFGQQIAEDVVEFMNKII